MAHKKLHWPKDFTGSLRIGEKTLHRPGNGELAVTAEEEPLLPLNIFGWGFYWIADKPAPEPTDLQDKSAKPTKPA